MFLQLTSHHTQATIWINDQLIKFIEPLTNGCVITVDDHRVQVKEHSDEVFAQINSGD